MKKLGKSIFILFFSLFFIISCNNSVSPFSLLPQDDDSNQSVNADSLIWVNATGSFTLDSEFFSSANSRAAFPEQPSDIADATYLVTATSGTLTSTGTVDSVNGTYSIGLAADLEWSITIEIKSGTSLLMSGSTANPVTPSATDPFVTVTETITLAPAMGSDPGNIVLSVDYSGISGGTTGWKLKVTLSKDGADPATIPAPVTFSGDDLGIISFSNIATGIWNAELKFLDSNDIPLYIDNQAINVYSNLTTRRWGASGGAIVYDSTASAYKYKLTDALLQEFARTTLWVGTTSVGSTPFAAKAPENGGNGTFVAPFQNLEQAINAIPASGTPKDYTINVSGEIVTSQPFTSSLNSRASSITVTGTTGSGTDSLKCVEADSSVLAINTSAKIIIKKLKITGGTYSGIRCSAGTHLTLSTDALVSGNSNDNNGGGVYLEGSSTSKAVLVMESSAKISGNSADNGGGVYMTDAYLYMSGSALIGDKNATEHAKADANKHSNVVTSVNGSGGAIFLDSGGEIWMGYNAPATTGGTPVADDSFTGGMFYNYAPSDGGAIYNNDGTIHIHKGEISFNATSDSSWGGAIYNDANLEIHMEGGTIKGNYAFQGGAIYNNGKLYMTGGVIGDATYQNTVKTGTGAGGAIYQYGVFEVSGSAKVWPGSLRTNDVYLCNSVTLANNLNTSGNTSSARMSITPDTLSRKRQVLAGVSYINDNYSKFSVTTTDWSVVPAGGASTWRGELDYPYIWVSGSGRAGDVSPVPTDNVFLGTKDRPYPTLSLAASEGCWNENTTYTIYISGRISGNSQVIPSDLKSKDKLTICGYSGNTQDIIDRGLSDGIAAEDGSAITINTTKHISFRNLTIKGGNTTGNGGGVNLAVQNGHIGFRNCVITGNKANAQSTSDPVGQGGGIYVSTGSKCFFNGGTLDSSHTEVSSNSATNGGGIYNDGYLEILDGLIDSNTAVGTDNSKYGNGGGIYNNGICCLGRYNNSSYAAKISENTADKDGGGIYNKKPGILKIGFMYNENYTPSNGQSEFFAKKFKNTDYCITKNTSNGSNVNNSGGGGIYTTGNVDINSGVIGADSIADGNKAHKGGGGIWVGYGTSEDDPVRITMTGGAISYNSVSNLTGEAASSYTGSGGGIYMYNLALLDISNGKIDHNTAPTKGGGVYCASSSINLSGASTSERAEISDNSVEKANGGDAINYSNGYGFNIGGYAYIPYTNYIFSNRRPTITITSTLQSHTRNDYIGLKFTSVSSGDPIVTADDMSLVSDNYMKFRVVTSVTVLLLTSDGEYPPP